MVAQAYDLPTRNIDEIFQLAKQKGYTNYGEIFSGMLSMLIFAYIC